MTTPDPTVAQAIADGQTALGIEFGSTRIKAVLIGPDHTTVATGAHGWENQFVDGLWTYSLESVWTGVQDAYARLAADVHRRHGVALTRVGSLGVSAMMHGYLPFDAAGDLLVPFRTWRNTNTERAVGQLAAQFGFHVPHRWSIAHLYQAILDQEEHVGRIDHLTTLAGYVHWQLTGERVLGIGDASGMFPIDIAIGGYDPVMVATFDDLAAGHRVTWRLTDLLPDIRRAGEPAGTLTQTGARLLDPTGILHAGTPLCAPEGDAGTGMVATNSITPRTGNVSAGTSIFAMVVLERGLGRAHHQLDLVTTPTGDPVAMVHCNNGTSEINAWAGLFAEFAAAIGTDIDTPTVFQILLESALKGAPDAGGLMAFNYLAGEPVTGLTEGRPLFVRSPGSTLDLATFLRTQLYAALATLRIGMDVLRGEEGVRLDMMVAHGGLFTTKLVAQRLLAAAIDTPVSVTDTASQGGPWGMAVLAAYLTHRPPGQSLAEYLSTKVFDTVDLDEIAPNPADVAGFDEFLCRYVAALPVQHAAVIHT